MILKQDRYKLAENLFLFLFAILPFMSVVSILFPIYNIGSSPLMGLLKEFIVAITIVLILYSTLKKKKIKVDNFYPILLAFIIYGAFHIISKASLVDAIDKFRLIYLYPVYFLALLYFMQNEKYKFHIRTIVYKVKNIFLVQIIIMIVFSILQLIFKGDILRLIYQERYKSLQVNLLGEKNLRLVSLMLNPINFALFCNIAIAFLLYSRKTKSKIRWILVGILSAFILLTFSRVGYVILIVEIAIYLIFFNSNMKRNIIIFSLAGLIFISLFVLVSNDIVNEKDYPILQRFTHLDLEYISNNSRIVAWENYLNQAFDGDMKNKLLGIGLGTASSSAALVESSDDIYMVESLYVTMLGELGIVGLILYLAIVVKYIYNSFIIKTHYRAKFYFLMTFLVIILLSGLTNNVHYNNPFSFYFYLVYFYTEIHTSETIRSGYGTKKIHFK